jgi:hypothetical protein
MDTPIFYDFCLEKGLIEASMTDEDFDHFCQLYVAQISDLIHQSDLIRL